MSISPEDLAAFADGELSGEDEARVAEAVAADAGLQRQVDAHRALKAKLGAHFAPVLDQPVPDRLTRMLTGQDNSEAVATGEGVVDFTKARAQKVAERSASAPRSGAWRWGGGAIAASLALAVMFGLGGGGDAPEGYAATQLASVLDEQLIAAQDPGGDTRILVSFRNESGELCRAFGAADASGIACRDATGWRLETLGAGSEAQQSEFRMAGSDAEVLEAAQAMAAGAALTAEEESQAREVGWQ